MPEVNISINNRVYEISCDNGQEKRVGDLGAYIDHRLQQIARTGGAHNDAHLFVLTALVIADELFEARESASSRSQPQPQAQHAPASKEEEKKLVLALEQLAKRIEGIAARVQAA
jgi:cell division protein ZapA